MIREISGDILLSKAQVIAHGVATNDSFHNGLAAAITRALAGAAQGFPALLPVAASQTRHAVGMDVIRRHPCRQPVYPGRRPGSPWRQFRTATLQNAGHALRELARLAVDEKFTSIALPRLSTGVGRLAWDDVQPLIQQHLGTLKIPVLVYATYHAGQKADEGL